MNRQVKGGLKPGEARSLGPSVQDIIDRDGDNPPEWFREVSYDYLGDDVLTVDRYITQEFHDLEMERMWSRVWQMACREEEIPEVGDHIVYDIGNWSFIVVRDAADSIKAFKNACLHRGTQLRDEGGSLPRFRCPFHGWTWNLDGSLAEVPCRWDFPHVTDEAYALPQVKVGTWGGFVFINMDENAMPLEEWLGVLPQHFSTFPLENRYMTANVRRIMPCNWKVAQEAFIESYHVVEAHSQAMPATGDANTQYDVFGDRISRLYTPPGVASPHVADPLDEQGILDFMLGSRSLKNEGYKASLNEGETARQKYADVLRGDLEKKYRADLSHLSITELLDNIEYFLFPNFFPWFNFSLPLIYRFRPNGNDPESSIMDVMLLHPVPDEGPRPEPAPLNVLRPDQPFTEAPELDQISFIFEQDVSNMPRVQKGMKMLEKGATLGNYQEIRLRHMHKLLDRYVATPPGESLKP
jgi:nitrite reductase/ring-hydroxylating ferredoxin subunit